MGVVGVGGERIFRFIFFFGCLYFDCVVRIIVFCKGSIL